MNRIIVIILFFSSVAYAQEKKGCYVNYGETECRQESINCTEDVEFNNENFGKPIMRLCADLAILYHLNNYYESQIFYLKREAVSLRRKIKIANKRKSNGTM